jgi:hypothetical protein
MNREPNSPKNRRSYSRYADLKAQGIVNSREHLDDLIAHHGFPAGFKLSHKCLIFDDDTVAAWLETKRVAVPPQPLVAAE